MTPVKSDLVDRLRYRGLCQGHPKQALLEEAASRIEELEKALGDVIPIAARNEDHEAVRRAKSLLEGK